jgi:hypothetical protein
MRLLHQITLGSKSHAARRCSLSARTHPWNVIQVSPFFWIYLHVEYWWHAAGYQMLKQRDAMMQERNVHIWYDFHVRLWTFMCLFTIFLLFLPGQECFRIIDGQICKQCSLAVFQLRCLIFDTCSFCSIFFPICISLPCIRVSLLPSSVPSFPSFVFQFQYFVIIILYAMFINILYSRSVTTHHPLWRLPHRATSLSRYFQLRVY